jgi:hypothetical protein
MGQGIANATVVIGTEAGELGSFLSTDNFGEAYFDSSRGMDSPLIGPPLTAA